MSPEPSPEELRAKLELSFERWRRRLDDPSPEDEPAAEQPAGADEDETAAA